MNTWVASQALVRNGARGALVFLVLLSAGLLGIAPPLLGGRLTIWLLGAGIAVAAVVRWGAWQYLAIYLADVTVDYANRHAALPALASGIGLPLGVWVTVTLLRRYRFDPRFEHGRDVALYVGAALVGMLLPAAVGVGSYRLYAAVDPVDLKAWDAADYFRWWLNDFTSVLLTGPLLIAMRRRVFQRVFEQPRATLAALALLGVLIGAMLFTPPIPAKFGFLQAPWLLALTAFVAVVCLRFGFVPAAVTALTLSLTAMICFAFDFGMLRGAEILPGLIVLWSYLIAMIVASLLLTGLLAEQQRLETRYEQVFETSPQPLWVCDAGTLRFLLVNAATERLYGFARGTLLAGTPELLTPPHEVRSLAALLAGEPHQPLELRQRTRDGRVIDVEIWARLIDYGGKPAWLAFTFDVTERKALESSLVNAISREQRRIGQELHDGLAQELTVASLLASQLATRAEEQHLPLAEDLRRLADSIAGSFDSARAAAHGLSPLAGFNGDLGLALASLARTSSIAGTAVELHSRFEAPLRLTLEAATHLYRIAQEAVQNALKHAAARRIEVYFDVRADWVMLRVVDDGRGIRPADANSSGFGINTIRYRTSAIGGQLSIRPVPTGGTKVTCLVPNPAAGASGLRLIGEG
ncbi:MAG TPA: PAS domain S-box protein [Steroidobacteraceae bacterium]|nr:PAS domain S-box protein [Steroidobacteraceae bacterium]